MQDARFEGDRVHYSTYATGLCRGQKERAETEKRLGEERVPHKEGSMSTEQHIDGSVQHYIDGTTYI